MSAAPTPPTIQAPGAGPSPAMLLRLVLVALGLLCLGLSVVARWLRPEQAEVFSLWAMLGLGLSALPVFYDSLTSLKADGFEATKYYMDQFVALAILACFATGQYATGTIVAAILIVGQLLEEHTTVGVEEAVGSLLRLSRVKARKRLADGAETLVEASGLVMGDRVRVLPGDTIPADGVVVEGVTTIDQASITGESMPVEAAVGGEVYAGTVNLTGSFELRVGRTGGDTVIGRVTAIVEEARGSRAPVMRLIDRYTGFYMPLVLIMAGLVLFFTRDVSRAIAVIIVAMPCAFVLASPSAMVAALAVASRLGLLVKSSRFFEEACRIDTVVFDKTGTLTTGQLRVVAVRPVGGVEADVVLAVAARVEAHSTHPIARAVLTEATRRSLVWTALSEVAEAPGLGVRGGGVLVGRRAWLASQGVTMPTEGEPESTTSILWVAEAGRLLGTIHLADTLRAETAATITRLRALGVDEFVMLTGDREAVAAEIARETGITRYRANCLPEEKLAEVRSLKAAGRRVMVVGDGVNDAPALAAGNVGVAMGALGSDVAIKTSDVALMNSDLRSVAHFVALSDRTLRIINQNLGWGLAFISLFVVCSALGWISPILAAVLHEFSAFFVIFNSARLLRYDEQAEPEGERPRAVTGV